MDPLAQLKDIHLPEAINNYPLAYGWWILFIITIVIIMLIITIVLRQKQKTKAQRAAIKHLSQTIESNDEIITTLKWAAIQYFPRKKIAQLHGQHLNDFLLQCLPEKHHDKFIKLSQEGFNNRYQPTENTLDTALLQAALLWLTHALPAKTPKHNIEVTND